MLARRRIAALGVIVGVALAVRLWVLLGRGELPPLGWLVLLAAQAAAGATIAAAVAFVAWSRLPERPIAGWLAATFAAIYPPHIWLVTAPSAALWVSLAVTALLIRPRQTWPLRVALVAGALLLVAAPPLVRHRVDTGSWSPVAAATSDRGDAEAENGPLVQRLARLRDFALYSGDGPQAADRLCRLAAVALLVMSSIGLAISCRHWRALKPTYLLIMAAALLAAFVYAPPTWRVVVEPPLFLWAAWTLVPMLSRTAAAPSIHVYQPGEQAHDPLEPHILPGPHAAAPSRRRAG